MRIRNVFINPMHVTEMWVEDTKLRICGIGEDHYQYEFSTHEKAKQAFEAACQRCCTAVYGMREVPVIE